MTGRLPFRRVFIGPATIMPIVLLSALQPGEAKAVGTDPPKTDSRRRSGVHRIHLREGRESNEPHVMLPGL